MANDWRLSRHLGRRALRDRALPRRRARQTARQVFAQHDIYGLNLRAELVVLSASETGLGKDVKGEGLEGLTCGFMYAGARRVVVSLRNVNDKATAGLMEHLHVGMLKNKKMPAAALRAAQIEMLRVKQWRAPY